MTRAVTLFSIGFWSVASVLILMEITADRSAMPYASLPARAFVPDGIEPLRVSPAGAASIDYRKKES